MDLEDRIERFCLGEADILIATTVIENGLDLPNVNTIFVLNADRFGISSLYQLRGRVGRSPRQVDVDVDIGYRYTSRCRCRCRCRYRYEYRYRYQCGSMFCSVSVSVSMGACQFQCLPV